MREGMKYDIHIKFKSYKLEFLGELIVYMVSKFGLVGGIEIKPSPCKFKYSINIYCSESL